MAKGYQACRVLICSFADLNLGNTAWVIYVT